MATSHIDKAKAVLERCERDLRALAVGALQEGEYEAARTLADLAQAVADKRGHSKLNAEEATAVVPRSLPASVTETSGSAAQPRRSANSRDYPRFTRSGDRLTKVAWSKKNKQEYEHSAPWASVAAFAAHLRARTRPGRIFSVDDLLPVPDSENGGELPAYQVYLSLAWLRSTGTIDKRGRNGYVVDHAALASETLSRSWAAVPSSER